MLSKTIYKLGYLIQGRKQKVVLLEITENTKETQLNDSSFRQ